MNRDGFNVSSCPHNLHLDHLENAVLDLLDAVSPEMEDVPGSLLGMVQVLTGMLDDVMRVPELGRFAVVVRGLVNMFEKGDLEFASFEGRDTYDLCVKMYRMMREASERSGAIHRNLVAPLEQGITKARRRSFRLARRPLKCAPRRGGKSSGKRGPTPPRVLRARSGGPGFGY